MTLFQIAHMAASYSSNNGSRRRVSFVDFAHPQVWHKLVEYSEATITLTKLSPFRQRRQKGSDLMLACFFFCLSSQQFQQSMGENLFLGRLPIAPIDEWVPQANRAGNPWKVIRTSSSLRIRSPILFASELDVRSVEDCTICGNRCYSSQNWRHR